METQKSLIHFLAQTIMNRRLLVVALLMVLLASSCKFPQYVNVIYKPHTSKKGYCISIPEKFQRSCCMIQNDYCYMFKYGAIGSSPATIYIHHYPMTFDVEEPADLVRAFYGDSVFCHYYRADLDEEDTLPCQPMHSQYIIDSVFRSLDYSDTIVLGGNDGTSAWKEIRIAKKIVVGYFNVPVQKRKLFEKAIWSLQPFDSTGYIDDYRKKLMSEGH